MSNPIKASDRTKAVHQLLVANNRIEEVKFHHSMYDADMWEEQVVPYMEYNLYRKRLDPLAKIQADNPRAAILGAALMNVIQNKRLIWMVLSKNQHTIVLNM